MHDTRPPLDAGGSLGIVRRKQLSPAVEAAVFAANNGAVVGPFPTGARYQLVQVEEILPGQLDAVSTTRIQGYLFGRRLAEQVQKAKAEVKLEQYL